MPISLPTRERERERERDINRKREKEKRDNKKLFKKIQSCKNNSYI